MDSKAFLDHAATLLQLLTEKHSTMRSQPASDAIATGVLEQILGKESPQEGVSIEETFQLLENEIFMHQRFSRHPMSFAYWGPHVSYESALADMVHGVLPGFYSTKTMNSVYSELEKLMCDWYGKAVGMPETFQYSGKTGGGGTFINSVTEGCLLVVNAARQRILETSSDAMSEAPRFSLMSKMVGYSSKQAQIGVEKMFRISGIRYRLIETLEDDSIDCATLKTVMEADIANGLIPVICVVTFGTTRCAAIDDIPTVGQLCFEHGVWLHVDAAYAGNVCICPEFRQCWTGWEFIDSVAISIYKGVVSPFCAELWLRDRRLVDKAHAAESEYVKGVETTEYEPDIHNMLIPMALKVWFTMSSLGIKGIQALWRKRAVLSANFQQLVENDARFEIAKKPQFNVVCFRLKGDNAHTEALYDSTLADGRVFLGGRRSGDLYYLLFVPVDSKM